MADVARWAGVSESTVSRVLKRSKLVRETTMKRLQAAIAELSAIWMPASRPGRRRREVTIAEVAAQAGVGVGTVSGVLNGSTHVSEATRERVQSVIARLDTSRAL